MSYILPDSLSRPRLYVCFASQFSSQRFSTVRHWFVPSSALQDCWRNIKPGASGSSRSDTYRPWPACSLLVGSRETPALSQSAPRRPRRMGTRLATNHLLLCSRQRTIERRSDIDKEIVEGNRRERRSSAVVMWGTKLGQISPESYKMVVEKRKELEQRLYNHNRQSPYHRKISILAFHCRTNSWTLRTFLWINTQTNSPIMAVFP